MALSTRSNFAKPDDAFRAVVEAHRGLSDAQSADLDAALVLVLAWTPPRLLPAWLVRRASSLLALFYIAAIFERALNYWP